MCGIVGFAGMGREVSDGEATLRSMCAAIVHRGPNEEGRFHAADVALGMRRLSVMDVAMGKQPMGNEDGTVQLVFNGEIYNHRQLRRELVARGHRIATSSDTEVIVHLYEEFGDDLVNSLRGMFAFALWDTARSRLLIARDRVGIKPLYYWEHSGGVAFASELRSLLSVPGFPRRVDAAAVAQYLVFGYVPESTCIFEGVRKLPPGHRLVWESGRGVHTERYWSALRPERTDVSEGEATEELRALLRESVELHLESDVPLGAFLSGGIDSSAVVAQMAQLVPGRVKTFSIGFEEASHNEAPHAAMVAREIGTEHTELIVRPDADALVESVITGFDEPFGDSSALPTFLVSQMAREHVTVALSGDGGDELFGGYTRYAELLSRRELPRLARRAIARVAEHLPQRTLGRNRILDLSRSRQGRYAATVAAPPGTREGGMLAAALAKQVPPMDALLAAAFSPVVGRDLLAQMTAVDLATYLPGDILTKVDRMSMSVSLEARVPLLDHHIVEFAAGIPSRMKYRDGVGKWLLRQAITGLVPARVLSHPKHGFGVPLARWFRDELRYRLEALQRPDARIGPYVDADAVARLIEEHRAGRRDHSHLLWRLLVLEVWLTALAEGRLAHSSPLADAVRSAAAAGIVNAVSA
ncbi:MAG TPA: asparagine synthase (glutamine-hydrolyzing) [Gemmatimonadaceae bacterium]|jgi:asparagine synthase (glutamine-hydrolysing)|nr:asparagine synthase (glutamine-hydrolyzing) [Gemmatimonadaceae bacterium]